MGCLYASNAPGYAHALGGAPTWGPIAMSMFVGRNNGTVPSAPRITSLTASDAAVEVAFDAPTCDGGFGPAALTYAVYAYAYADGAVVAVVATGASSPVLVTGLANDVPIAFVVVAANEQGPGPASGPSPAVTPTGVGDPVVTALPAPGAPTGTAPADVSASAGAGGRASVSFASTDPAALAFTATSSPHGFAVTGAASPLAFSQLITGTAYTFTVASSNAVDGVGPPSDASAAVVPYTIPGAPTAVTSTLVAPGNITVAYSPPADVGGSPILGYAVVVGLTATATAPADATSVALSGFAAGVPVVAFVAASNAAGVGPWSAASPPVTPFGAPAPPLLLSVASSNASLLVRFAPSASDVAGTTAYFAQATPGGLTSAPSFSASASAPLVLPGLVGGSNYAVCVWASNAWGTAVSSTSNAGVPLASAPVPTGAYLTSNASGLRVFFSPAWNACYPVAYRNQLVYTATAQPGGAFAMGVVPPLELTGLSSNTAYAVTLTARHLAGETRAAPLSALTTSNIGLSSNEPGVTPADVRNVSNVSCWIQTPVMLAPALATVIGGQGFSRPRYLDASIPTSNLVAWYTAESYSPALNLWRDITGNGYHAVTGGPVQVGPDYIYGNTSATVVFPVGVLPPSYTFVHVMRYNGGSHGRIFTGTAGNWLSGYWSNNSPVAHHDGWVTTSSSAVPTTVSPWRIITDRIAGIASQQLRSDGVNVGTGVAGGTAYRICINANGEQSDWAAREIVVFNVTLTDAQVIQIERSLQLQYEIVFIASTTWTPPANMALQVLVVGGGGGGGFNGGGGGAGGGVTYVPLYWVAGGTVYTVTVGAGGGPATNASTVGIVGGTSAFGAIQALGGGGGYTGLGAPVTTAIVTGGCGGGGGYYNSTSTATTGPGLGTVGQGFNGGNAWLAYNGGGGGGAGAPGQNAQATYGGGGGEGFMSAITGTPTFYGGGGGGGSWNYAGGGGGLGGGGQGGTMSTNNMTAGTVNTGGGGGGNGASGAGAACAGGSGIVVIKMLPDSYSPGAQPALGSLSSNAMANLRGAYSLKRFVPTYVGPALTVRRSTDNAAVDVYADTLGALELFASGSGSNLAAWLGAATGYVATWYDQSGSGNHATQASAANQPVIAATAATKVIDCLNSSSLYFNIPSGTVPVGTLNAPYSFVVKHGTINNTTSGGFIGSGAAVTNCANCLRCNGASYLNYWYGNDLGFGSAVANGNVVSAKYDGVTRTGYVNGSMAAAAAGSGYTNTAAVQSIGRTVANEYLNGQLYFVYIFRIPINDADRFNAESFP